MEIKNNLQASQSFGMAFSSHRADCQKYLASNFHKHSHQLNKALKVLEARCDAHKYFDMFHSSHDNSIKIIGKTDLAGKKLSEKYGSAILSLSKNTEYPNFSARAEIALDGLLRSKEAPKNKMEKALFKAYRYFYMKYAKFHVYQNPYENLPPNIRKAVDIIDKLETEI